MSENEGHKFIPVTSEIEGVVFIPLKKHHDERGWLCELFRGDCLDYQHQPHMGYVSQTEPGVARGPHEHKVQSDLFVFMGPGKFVLQLWENRDYMEGYKKGLGEYHTLGEDEPYAVIVPPGVVHGYRNVSNYPGVVYNFPNQLYAGPGKIYPVDEIRHEDGDKFVMD